MINEQQLLENAAKDGIQKITTGVVAKHGNKILIVRRNAGDFLGGMWELPGGGKEPTETIVGAATRELAEETNLIVKKVLGYLGDFGYESKSGKKTRQFNILVEVQEPVNVKLTEHDAHEWSEPKIARQKVSDSVKIIIDESIKYIN